MRYTVKAGDVESTYEADTSQQIIELINAVDSTAKSGYNTISNNSINNATTSTN